MQDFMQEIGIFSETSGRQTRTTKALHKILHTW